MFLQGVFSNAYHILTKLVPSRPQASYTLTVSHRSGSSAPSTRSNHGGIRFSLSVYSACPFALRDAGPATLPYVDEVSGEWTKRTSGGHHGLATFGDNPMWRLTIGGAKAVEVRVRLVAKRKEDDAVQGDAVDPGSDMTKPINVKIVRSTGDGRVFQCASSGDTAFVVLITLALQSRGARRRRRLWQVRSRVGAPARRRASTLVHAVSA